MFIKLVLFLLVAAISMAQQENQSWDVAMVIDNTVLLFNKQKVISNYTFENLNKFKAITFDTKRHQFIISEETNGSKDTIYTLQLSKETDINPIVPNLPDDVQGLAVDPVNDTLYWTEIEQKTISYVSIKGNISQPKILFNFTEEIPQDVAVDSCKRFLFWTNSNSTMATIERSTLEGYDRKILINDDLHKPSGIAIDQSGERIYWADRRQGIYFRIESADFNGANRQTLYEDTHQRPYGLAVDKDYVYWTDTTSKSLWRKHKLNSENPELLLKFDGKPMGIVAMNVGFSDFPDCKELILEENLPVIHNREYHQNDNYTDCINGQMEANGFCKCNRGYSGRSCQFSACYNYCNKGSCVVSDDGPQCTCYEGFEGNRCERNICNNYCLNDGICALNGSKSNEQICTCKEGYTGNRCEISLGSQEFCKAVCYAIDNGNIIDENLQFACRCNAFVSTTKYSLSAEDSLKEVIKFLQDPIFLWVLILVMIVIVTILLIKVYKLKHVRPRIKKRIVVNKNVTPLTYRPQLPTEQCEITIENCCNMNVCETPCFEPPTRKDEKKNLLAHMEQNEDLY